MRLDQQTSRAVAMVLGGALLIVLAYLLDHPKESR